MVTVGLYSVNSSLASHLRDRQVRQNHILVCVVQFLDDDGKALPGCFASGATHAVSDGVIVEYTYVQ